MKTHRGTTELGIWAALALAGGFLPAWIDRSATNVQGPAAILMLVNFALTLPGRAPVWLVAVCSWLAMPITHAIAVHDVNPMMIIGLVPAFIGAGGGRLAGALLDTAASKLADARPDDDRPWLERPLSTRFLLAVALIVIAAAGLPSAAAGLLAVGHKAPDWVALVWQIMTLLGWIGLTPMILAQRPVLARSAGDSVAGIRPLELLAHLVVVFMLAIVHAAVIVALSAALFIPLAPSGLEFARAAFHIYLPLDLLAYLSILTLGFASDVERHRRDAARREAALNAETLDTRMSALRARLNPHFLFNALNSVTVLARGGKTAETTRVVEGLTTLLRYVLDERRPMVPLREELEFARQYLEVQQVRFGDRLIYELASEPSADAALVPQLLLQPIVENAVEHGVATTLEGGRVAIAASVDGDALMVTVDDDGPGPPLAGSPDGVGLATTRERLRRLYETRATLTIGRRQAGGTRVAIALPLDTSTTSA